jgi:RNA polymerase sigma-70 factor, ECF subfamily
MTSAPATDPALVRGLLAGRRDAFERLYGEYYAAIYNLCARILGDREEARDVTHEVFIKAFDQLPAADAESFGLRPWLYRVATNACFNHLRSRRRLDGGGDAGLEHAAANVDEFERAQTVALVERSLGEMNERYRTALVLKDLQGLPPEEIAEVMEVSRANADVLVHRARASFKTVFAKLAGTETPAPAALGVVLLPLSLPAALRALPPLPAHFAPVHAPLHPVIPAAAGPTGAGLLTKIAAALTTKAAITAAATAVVIGGGVVAVREADKHATGPAAAAASTRPAAVLSLSPATYAGLHDGRGAGHALGMGAHHRGLGHHAGMDGHHPGHHSGSVSHDSAAHDADDGGSPAPAATHESATTTTHTGDRSSSTTTHAGGDMPDDGHGGSHE